MHFRRRLLLPTVSGYETWETSKVRPSFPLRAASSRLAGIPEVLFPINGPTVFNATTTT